MLRTNSTGEITLAGKSPLNGKPSKRVLRETIVLFSESRQLKTKPNRYTVYNWARRGCLNRFTMRRVYLEFAYRGGAPCTSHEAFDRFLDAMADVE